ncbi:MAG: DUF2267 domain-containing protein [Candidatus Promineifilaceae bacterium]|nr:DUF2267 domain-containing protein [Candidatus Promineifilaceae bacterium]
MRYQDFVGQVQHRSRLGEQGRAVGAIRATLETLSERIVSGEAENLADQLPREIGYYLRQAKTRESFELDEFYQRVAQREEVDYPDAVHHARVVMSVVNEAATPGEMDKVRGQLPDEYDDLFTLAEAEQADS